MKKFRFTWSRTDSFEHTVEAETEEEARKKFEEEKYEDPKVYSGSEFNLELNGEREVPPSQPAKLLRAVEVIFEYLKESESVGGEIDGWENLQKDLKDLKEKALTEIDFLEMES